MFFAIYQSLAFTLSMGVDLTRIFITSVSKPWEDGAPSLNASYLLERNLPLTQIWDWVLSQRNLSEVLSTRVALSKNVDLSFSEKSEKSNVKIKSEGQEKKW